MVVAVLISACTAGPQPFGKEEGSAQPTETILPPAEAFKPAGPGAEKDVDYETVYGPGILAPPGSAEVPVDQAAVQPEAPPEDPAAATPETPSTKPAEQKSAAREIKAVSVTAVKGAPGQGNSELTAAMKKTLRSAGWPVIDAPREDAITIAGNVSLGEVKGKGQTVALSWTVKTYDGTVLGTIKQANTVPAGSLDKSWGEAAGYAAEAGATGIYDLIKRYR